MADLIKRYANRKLYDVQARRYVTLEDVEEMVRGGREVRVVDAATGKDLTSVTLTQVILESERHRGAPLPSAFLHQVVRYGAAWQDFLQESLRASLQGLTTSQRQAERVFREWAARAGLGVPEERPAGEAAAPPRGAGPAPEEPAGLRDEVETLRARLEALERAVRRPPRAVGRPAKTRKAGRRRRPARKG